MSESVSPGTTTCTPSETHIGGVGAAVDTGLGAGVAAGVEGGDGEGEGVAPGAAVGAVATGVEAGDGDVDADGTTGDVGGAAGPGIVTGVTLDGDDDPSGVGEVGVPAHAARRTPRRRDAAWRFAFICRRRWCCGLSRR